MPNSEEKSANTIRGRSRNNAPKGFTWTRAPTPIRGRLGIGRYPRVIEAGNLLPESAATTQSCTHCSSPSIWSKVLYSVFPFMAKKQSINDPMLHHDNWQPADEDYILSIDGYEEGLKSAEENLKEEQCVPMAAWQTTSYPNCNSVHEIDMKFSSGPGSYAFPKKRSSAKPYRRRRSVASHPPMLARIHKKILEAHPDAERKKKAKMAAQGKMREEYVEFLGQGWFRGAWEVYAEGVPPGDEDWEEEEDADGGGGGVYEGGVDESVVLKTLRYVLVNVFVFSASVF